MVKLANIRERSDVLDVFPKGSRQAVPSAVPLRLSPSAVPFRVPDNENETRLKGTLFIEREGECLRSRGSTVWSSVLGRWSC